MSRQVEILQKLLEKIANEKKYNNHTLDIKELSSGGANYTSLIYRAIISSPGQEDIDLFAKVANMSDKSRSEIPVDRFFKAERFVYEELAEIYNKIQENYDVTAKEKFRFPKYYGTNANCKEESVVLENLVSQGFGMYDRFQPVTWEYAKKAVQELAKFHSLSYAYQNIYPEDFARNCKELEWSGHMPLKAIKESFTKMAELTYPYLEVDIKNRLKKFVDAAWTEESFEDQYGKGNWPVFVHGDYRSSNILHKYQEEKVVSLVPIDYQTTRLASPCTDLLYFIYSGTDEQFRAKHWDEILDAYYRSLATFLKMLKLDPDTIYSRQNFEEDFKGKLGHGLCTSIFTLPITLVDAAKAPNMSDEGSGLTDFRVEPNEAFVERFLPIVNDFIKFGVL